VLRVDLTGGRIVEKALCPKIAKDYIGGRGLGIHAMLTGMDPCCDPLGPENLLIMATGPLTGTIVPSAEHGTVMTKSPLTGAVTFSSSWGRFPAALKHAGIDMIVFSGAAPSPVYVWIDQGRSEIRPADHLWGMGADETDTALRIETHRDVRAACIGPAGEHGVRFTGIVSDRRQASGRSGAGAVMGAKKLKAVVVRGDRPVPLWNQKAFSHDAGRYCGNLEQRLDGRTLKKKDPDVPSFEREGEGPEYENISAMGAKCGVYHPGALVQVSHICNAQGMDAVAMGCTIACAMALSEKGYLPEADVGLGRRLRYGDAEALVQLTRLTVLAEGFGKVLAEGSFRLARRYGHPELAIGARGREFADYDSNPEPAMGLAGAAFPAGPSRVPGDPAYIGGFGLSKTIDLLAREGEAGLVMARQNHFAVIDAAGLCPFFTVRSLMSRNEDSRLDGIRKLLNAATGEAYTLEELVRAGERIFNAERLFLLGAGVNAGGDTLPRNALEDPMPDGQCQGMGDRLKEMIGNYYRLRGWDEAGRPSPNKLRTLGLSDIPIRESGCRMNVP